MSGGLRGGTCSDEYSHRRIVLGISQRRGHYPAALMLSSLKLSSSLAMAITSAFALSPSDAVTLCGVSGVESGSGLLPYVAGNGALNADCLVLFDNATGSVSESLAASDFGGATAWIASLPENEERDAALGVYVISISMGGTQVNAEILNSALRLAIEEGQEIPGDDRGRGRGSESNDREIEPNWILSSSSTWQVIDPGSIQVASVPEPSFAVLGIIGTLGLLRRRRL